MLKPPQDPLKDPESYDQTPETLTADAGYGSEENYTDLEEKHITAFVKYNYFHKEQRDKKHQENPFHPDNLFYNAETDTYYCPMGQEMRKVQVYETKTKNGFTQEIHRYQAQNSHGCPLRSCCHKAKGNRIIEHNHNLIGSKKKQKTYCWAKME